MSPLPLLHVLGVLLLAGYLVVALVRPEWFE